MTQAKMNSVDVLRAINGSCDEWGDHTLGALLRDKWEECSEGFIADIRDNGVQYPVVIMVSETGSWTLGNGNHRLVVASSMQLDIPVQFTFEHDVFCIAAIGVDTGPKHWKS